MVVNMRDLTEQYLRECVKHGHDTARGIMYQVLLDKIGKNAKDRIQDMLDSIERRAK